MPGRRGWDVRRPCTPPLPRLTGGARTCSRGLLQPPHSRTPLSGLTHPRSSSAAGVGSELRGCAIQVSAHYRCAGHPGVCACDQSVHSIQARVCSQACQPGPPGPQGVQVGHILQLPQDRPHPGEACEERAQWAGCCPARPHPAAPSWDPALLLQPVEARVAAQRVWGRWEGRHWGNWGWLTQLISRGKAPEQRLSRNGPQPHLTRETEAWRGDGIGLLGTQGWGLGRKPRMLTCWPRPQNAS